MPSLAEILAAKKAKANAGNGVPSNEQPSATVQSAPPAAVQADVGNANVQKPNANDAHAEGTIRGNAQEQLAKEVLTDASGKPLSGFALIQRRKELAKQAENAASIAKVVEVTKEPEAVVAEKIEEKIVETKPQEIPAPAAIPANTSDVAPETLQAYADIKLRIEELVSKSEIDLKNAMQELKRALMQNPAACALMLPSDIGQMVIALRKMTGVELAKAEENKKPGRKPAKEKAMTAEELEDAFKEL